MTEYKFDICYVDAKYNYATHRTEWLTGLSFEDAFKLAVETAFSKFGGNVRGVTLADTF